MRRLFLGCEFEPHLGCTDCLKIRKKKSSSGILPSGALGCLEGVCAKEGARIYVLKVPWRKKKKKVPWKKDKTPTVCQSGLGCGLRGMVFERLVTPSISKENNDLASARGMKASLQEKPEFSRNGIPKEG